MAKSIGHPGQVAFLALVLLAGTALAQQQSSAAPDGGPQAPPQGAQQPLDLQEAAAHDVLEPLQAGIQSRDLKQVLSVFDAQSVPDFPQFRDRMKAFLDAYSAVQFRYKILQASSEDTHASMTCEFDLDATPVDTGQVPKRRSTQMRLQLKQTPKGWLISSFSPSDFFTP